MTLQRKRRRSKMIIAAGAFIALVVAAVVFLALQAGGVPAAEQAITKADVVVAAQEIQARRPIEPADLTMASVVLDQTNTRAYRSMDDVVGRVSAVSIPAGQLVTPNLLASATSNQGFSFGDPASYDPEGPANRAVSIQVTDARAVAGTIEPGQRVDVIATVRVTPTGGGDTGVDGGAGGAQPGDLTAGPTTKVTLQNVSVLSREADIYILLVDLEQAEQIAEIQAAGGEFAMALRPDVDDRVAETEGSTLDSIIEQYGFPPPRVANLRD
jgi:Flp pilus assembly protein CpaB